MNLRLIKLSLLLFSSVLFVPTAHATLIGFSVSFASDLNTPVITLRNTSEASGPELDTFSLTIGDSSFNFDAAFSRSGAIVPLTQGDTNFNGGIRVDELRFDYRLFNIGGIAPSSFRNFEIDVDGDTDVPLADQRYDRILFNNGTTVPNAVATAVFRNGFSLSGTLSDTTATNPVFSFSENVSAVPIPATFWLFLTAIAPILRFYKK